jgi:D-tyrosyl-tRNA(Tyr) deacylase
MKSLIQVVEEAEVKIDSKVTGSIGRGLLIFLGIKKGDEEDQVEEMAERILGLRIFPDDDEKMNLSVEEVEGEVLVVSQFTLYGQLTSGRRPNFSKAGDYDKSKKLYREFVDQMKEEYPYRVESGKFGSYMKVNLTNDGPITFTLES